MRRRRGILILSGAVYAELLALAKWSNIDLDAFVLETRLRVDWNLPQEIWTEAGLAFGRYARRRLRQKSGAPRKILADFIIGAHARAVGGLLTADMTFYRTNFPELVIVEL